MPVNTTSCTENTRNTILNFEEFEMLSKDVPEKLILISSSKSMIWLGALILEYANEIVVIILYEPEMTQSQTLYKYVYYVSQLNCSGLIPVSVNDKNFIIHIKTSTNKAQM